MNENHTRVEAYLDQLLIPLARNLSDFHRDELRRELRAHLWGRVDAYRELDYSEEDAVTEALRQFGGANDFARQWRQEWLRKPPKLTLREVYEAGKLALRPTLLGLAGVMLPCTVLQALAYRSDWAPGPAQITFAWTGFLFAFFGLPTLIGIQQGRRSSERAGIGMLTALTAELLTLCLVYGAADWVMPGGIDTAPSGKTFGICFGLLVAWLPLASGAAAISGWLTRRRTKARLLA